MEECVQGPHCKQGGSYLHTLFWDSEAYSVQDCCPQKDEAAQHFSGACLLWSLHHHCQHCFRSQILLLQGICAHHDLFCIRPFNRPELWLPVASL